MCFENVFEIDAFVSATNVIDSCLSVLQKCVSFRKDVSKCFLRVCFESVYEVWFLKRRQVFLQVDLK